MSKTCGTCKYFKATEEMPAYLWTPPNIRGECHTKIPMWMDYKTDDVNFHEDASECPCYKKKPNE